MDKEKQMAISFNLKDGMRVRLVMPHKHAQRLLKTCFRGFDCYNAGNFFAWSCFRDFVNDRETRRLLKEQFERILADPEPSRQHRLQLEFKDEVGWTSTIDLHSIDAQDLLVCKMQNFNDHAAALFLPDNRIYAPRTNLVTMVVSLRRQTFFVGTIYPGRDCGRLKGENLTATRNLIWLRWSNPGE